MLFSIYDNFSKEIEQNNIQNVENIFGSSDIRCNLISHSLKYHSKGDVILVINSFKSKALKDQALSLCDNCPTHNCQIKQEVWNQQNIKHYTNEENKILNQNNYLRQVIGEKNFDIHSGEYIEN